MKVIIAELLRKIAYAIEIDRTPTDKELEDQKKTRMKVVEPIKALKTTKTRSGDDTVEHNVVKPTARPGLKPTRRKPSYKPSDWDSKEHRRKYQEDWRSEGKDVETGNKYIKKNNKK
jgi:hypothetical protein